jgi:hypothetical protein
MLLLSERKSVFKIDNNWWDYCIKNVVFPLKFFLIFQRQYSKMQVVDYDLAGDDYP